MLNKQRGRRKNKYACICKWISYKRSSKTSLQLASMRVVWEKCTRYRVSKWYSLKTYPKRGYQSLVMHKGGYLLPSWHNRAILCSSKTGRHNNKKARLYTTVYEEVLYQLEQYLAAVKTDLKRADHTRRERECRYKWKIVKVNYLKKVIETRSDSIVHL